MWDIDNKPIAFMSPLSETFYQLYGQNLSEELHEPRIWKRPLQKVESSPGDGGSDKLEEDRDEERNEEDIEEGNSSVSSTVEEDRFAYKRSNIVRAVAVRLLLVAHVVLTAWRVTVVFNDNIYWTIVLAIIPLALEGVVTLSWRNGIEYQWWCPCFLTYLLAVHPLVWLLQLNQYEVSTNQHVISDPQPLTSTVATATTLADVTSTSLANLTSAIDLLTSIASTASTVVPSSTTPGLVNLSSTIDLLTSLAATASTVEPLVTATAPSPVNLTSTIDLLTSLASTASVTGTSVTPTSLLNLTSTIDPLTNVTFSSVGNQSEKTPLSSQANTTEFFNISSTSTTTTAAAAVTNGGEPEITDDELWLIIIEESLIYLMVLGRWLLPQGHSVSREFLADLLLEFLAIASDIMELLAVFDTPEVRSSLTLTYTVMAVWSASFIQFIPLLAHKRKYFRVRSPNIRFITRACGDHFVEVVVTCMSIFFQDGPFLAVRLYIIISLKTITYSLAFFVLKNVVTLLLLWYRLCLLCINLPCFRRRAHAVQNGDVAIKPPMYWKNQY